MKKKSYISSSSSSYLLLVINFFYLLNLKKINGFKNNELIKNSNDFGFEIMKLLNNEINNNNKENNKDIDMDNIVISSFSIESCLSVPYEGAVGDTKIQMMAALQYPKEEEGEEELNDNNTVFDVWVNYSNHLMNIYDGAEVEEKNGGGIATAGNVTKPSVKIANRVWLDSEFEDQIRKSYIDKIGSEYFYILDLQDSDTVDFINDWISNKTDGMITDALKGIDPLDVMLIVNTLYVSAFWRLQFPESMTSENTFYTDVSRSIAKSNIHLMHQIGRFDYYENDVFQFVKLDAAYSNGNLFVLLALPKKTSYNFIDMDDVKEALDNLQSTRVALALPKFYLRESYKLKTSLETLGMTDAFSSSAANFSKMTPAQVYISRVQHDTALEVTEKGFTAAAVTIVTITFTSVETTKPKLFKADHPFYFLVIDTSLDENSEVPVVLFSALVQDITIPENSEAVYDESIDRIWTTYPDASNEPTDSTDSTGSTDSDDVDPNNSKASENAAGNYYKSYWMTIFWVFYILWLGGAW